MNAKKENDFQRFNPFRMESFGCSLRSLFTSRSQLESHLDLCIAFAFNYFWALSAVLPLVRRTLFMHIWPSAHCPAHSCLLFWLICPDLLNWLIGLWWMSLSSFLLSLPRYNQVGIRLPDPRYTIEKKKKRNDSYSRAVHGESWPWETQVLSFCYFRQSGRRTNWFLKIFVLNI